MADLQRTPTFTRPGNGGFVESCLEHVTAQGAGYDVVEIGGVSPYDTRLSEALLASAELEQVDTSGLDALGMSPTGVISWYLQYHSPDSSLVTDNDLSDVQQMQIGALDTVTKENPRHVWYAYQRHGFNRHRPDPKPHTLT